MAVKEIKKVGNRGTVFTFADDISVYLIEGISKWFLCDTHLGPDSMEYIKNYILEQAKEKPVIVFNSHSDWDHVWGNCAFPTSIIVGHDTMRKRLQDIGQYELNTLTKYHAGSIELVLPNMTFSQSLTFADEKIECIHAPGHTIDSAVCYDRQDGILFVGDLVEEPFPYLDFIDLKTYIKTLEWLKDFPARLKVSAHSGIVDNQLIDKNINYIKAFLYDEPINPEVYQSCLPVHNFNINNRLYLKYEDIVRIKLQDMFDYTLFKGSLPDLKQAEYKELLEALENYCKEL